MLRKMAIVVTAAATFGGVIMASSTDASAQWRGVGWGGGVARVGGWGWRGPGWGWGGGWGWRGAGWGPGWGWGVAAAPIVVGVPVVVSCWRWVPTVWGPARVWVC